MIEQKQQFRHDPSNGVYGDCFRTAVACLLGVDRGAVPHVSHDGATGSEAERRMNAWLGDRGLTMFALALPGDMGLVGVLNFCARLGGEPEYLLGGSSKNGTDHMVICKGARIAWDPAIDDSGIVGPASNGMFLAAALAVCGRGGQ